MDQKEKQVEIILNEISECREDERDAQEQILQTIGVGGAIIGVLTGASFAGNSAGYIRWVFVLAALIFFVVFGNIISLGVGNVLRYHYLQDLEDQLRELFGEDYCVAPFWKSISSPVMTRNIKHVKSRYAVISFGSLAVAAVCALAFCFLMMLMMFFQIEQLRPIDWFGVGVFLTGVLICGYSFILICLNSKKMYVYCKENSLRARDLRRKEGLSTLNNTNTVKCSRKDLFQVMVYYLYPRLSDLQKPLLMVVGYLMGWFLFRDSASVGTPVTLFWSWVVVDLMIYQSRLLWNDIRGLSEDMDARKTNRLPVHILGVSRAISIGLIVMAVKTVLAALILWFLIPHDLSVMLLLLIGIIVVVAVFYEICSRQKLVPGVYALVSVGYPVRMLTGLLTAKPDLFTAPLVSGGFRVPQVMLVFLIAAYGLLGVYSSLLSWCHQAVGQKKQLGHTSKSYYQTLLDQLGERFSRQEPLMEKGRLTDCWNVVFLLSLAMLSVIPLWMAPGSGSLGPVILAFVAEVVMIVLAGMVCCAGKNRWLRAAIMTGLFMAVKAWAVGSLFRWGGLYMMICCNQLFAHVLYCFMRFLFQPDFDFVKACREAMWIAIGTIVGPDTMILVGEEMKRKKKEETLNGK